MNIFKEVLRFWKDTWINDKVLFFSEATGTCLGMTASTILNLQAQAPNMLVVLILYFISAVLLAYSSYKRQSAFLMLLMSFYACTAIIGLSVLLT